MQRYVKTNSKYMKNYGKSKESSYLMYLDKQFLWMGNVPKAACKRL